MPQHHLDQNMRDRWVQCPRTNLKITRSWTCMFSPDERIFYSSNGLMDASGIHENKTSDNLYLENLGECRAQFEANSQRCLSHPIDSHSASLKPPVTKTKLLELGVNKIMHNPKLWHDINFDPELCFGLLNLDGEKGGGKAKDQSGFYELMGSQPRDLLTTLEIPKSNYVNRGVSVPPFRIEGHAWDLGIPRTSEAVLPEVYGKIDEAFFLVDSNWTHYRRNYFIVRCPYSLVPTAPPLSLEGVQSGAIFSQSCDVVLANVTIVHERDETPPDQLELNRYKSRNKFVNGNWAGSSTPHRDSKSPPATRSHAKPLSEARSQLSNEQWQAMMRPHRALYGHHDFFLASQHPSANPALRRLSSKYAISARMWRYCIHSLLELSWYPLLASPNHMLAFIYLAYSTTAPLYESIPAFEDTWIRYIGDRCHYRMAIEDVDIRDRAIWAGVTRDWVSKASDNGPTIGPSYHHLAILARPFVLQQLSYEKCLCASARFSTGRKSIMTGDTPLALDTDFARVHGLFLAHEDVHRIDNVAIGSLNILDGQIGGVTWTLINQLCSTSTTNHVSGFGSEANPCMKATSPMREEELPTDEPATSTSDIENALEENTTTLAAFCQHTRGPNMLPYIHAVPTFMYQASTSITDQVTMVVESIIILLNSVLCVDLRYLSYVSGAIILFQIPGVSAAPPSPPPASQPIGVPVYFKDAWKSFSDEIAGPLLANNALAMLLAMAYLVLMSRRMAHILVFAHRAMSIGVVYIGLDSRISSYQLGFLWISGFMLNYQYLDRKLSTLPASGNIITAMITFSSLVLSFGMAYFSPGLNGRYSNWLVCGGVTALPMSSFLIWFWVVFILETGIAEKIDRIFQ